jgi:hypothetical protein
MNATALSTDYIAPRPEVRVTEHRSPIACPREDPFFQGWGPRL